MRALMDSVDVDKSADGTTVRMTRRLGEVSTGQPASVR
jgi:hypothetical protein